MESGWDLGMRAGTWELLEETLEQDELEEKEAKLPELFSADFEAFLIHLSSELESFLRRLENLPRENTFSGIFFEVLRKLIGVLRRIFLSFCRSLSVMMQLGFVFSLTGFCVFLADLFDDS